VCSRRLSNPGSRPLKLTVRHSVRTPRQLMDAALKSSVVPLLREHGFKGSYPHFRRHQPTGIDLLTFQFSQFGGSFVVEIGTCGLGGVTLPWGKSVGPSKVTALNLSPAQRHRLVPPDTKRSDYWFKFDAGDYDAVASHVAECLTHAWSGRDS
jgi:hypothetical protein